MSDTPRPRGRPKGTGIDDRDTLRAVMALLSRDATLKPTTAIRLSGVTDPSVVRRLREKLKLTPISPPEPRRKTTSSRSRAAPRATSQLQGSKPTERLAASGNEDQRKQTDGIPVPQDNADALSTSPRTTADASVGPAVQPMPNSSPQRSTLLADPQLEALRLSAEAAAAVSRLYLHCMNYASATNPMSLALRSQTVMSQWIAGLLSGSITGVGGMDKK